MSFRIEDKLYINKENLFAFKKFLNEKTAKKIHKPRVIESLYFDNDAFQIYNDSIEGLVPRKKIRVRNYPQNKDTKIYLEVKNSSVEGRFKTRKIINNRYYKDLKSNGIFDTQYGPCKPILYVKYNREYLLFKDVRISIDTNITFKSFTTNYEMRDDRIIAELKTSINKNLDELMEDFPLQRIRFSKYSFGVEKLFHH